MAEIKVPMQVKIQVNLPDDWVEQIIERLRNDPEAEWVEIIRCKDCKHKPSGSGANHYISFPDEVCPCQSDDYWYSWIPKDDWYCANAERREE